MKCTNYLFVAILENDRHLGFLIDQSYRMELITIEMSLAKFGDCISIHPKNAYRPTICSKVSVAHKICNCRKILCRPTLHLAIYMQGSVYTRP